MPPRISPQQSRGGRGSGRGGGAPRGAGPAIRGGPRGGGPAVGGGPLSAAPALPGAQITTVCPICFVMTPNLTAISRLA